MAPPNQEAAPSPARAAADLLGIAGAAGLLSGSLYALAVWLLRVVGGRLSFHSGDLLWMAPLASGGLFLALALLLALPALVLRRRFPAWLAAGGFGFLAIVNLLAPVGGLARWALLLLAFGVGLQLARGTRRSPRRWTRRLVLAGAAMGAIVIGAGLVRRGVRALQRSATLGGLGAPSPGAPNVLLIILDTVRGANLSVYGYPRPTTPALQRWGAQGVVFEQAFATAPWTLPSHGSLFTGELGPRLGGGWVAPARPPGHTLAELLQQRGYRTAGFVANLLYTSYESGLTRGFAEYSDFPVSLRQLLLHCPLARLGVVQGVLEAKERWQIRRALTRMDLRIDREPADQYVSATSISDAFLKWQAGIAGRPFFAFLNYFDAHAPYRAPAAIMARFAAGSAERDGYDGAIAYLDAELDRVFRTLEQRGVLEQTIVVVSSDHGELLGEHELHGHANALYLPVLRVPLLIRYPKAVPAGIRVGEPVSLRDVPATILELAGESESLLAGRSLVDAWDPSRRSIPPEPVLSEVMRGRYRNDPNFLNAETWLQSALDGEFHYIRSGAGKEELFAWRSDTLELQNLAGRPESAAAQQRLRAALEQAFPTPR